MLSLSFCNDVEDFSTEDILFVESESESFEINVANLESEHFTFSSRPYWVRFRKPGTDGVCISSVVLTSADGTESDPLNDTPFWLDHPCEPDLKSYQNITCKGEIVKFYLSRTCIAFSFFNNDTILGHILQ